MLTHKSPKSCFLVICLPKKLQKNVFSAKTNALGHHRSPLLVKVRFYTFKIHKIKEKMIPRERYEKSATSKSSVGLFISHGPGPSVREARAQRSRHRHNQLLDKGPTARQGTYYSTRDLLLDKVPTTRQGTYY